MTYMLKLLKKDVMAGDVMAFHFEKPAGFVCRAGQYGDFMLTNPPETDAEGTKRTFTLASAPYESSLMIATRIRDTSFKRTLKNMEVGSEIMFDGPFGSLTLDAQSSLPVVFLAGGIGVTLPRSIITQATHEQLPRDLILLSSNHSPQDGIFMEEFTRLAAHNKHFSFVPTVTDPDDSWTGEKGLITIDMIRRHVSDITSTLFYLSGPIPMVNAMRTMLTEAGVNKFNMRIDDFIGY